MTESDSGTTCGPIAAWNLLYHFDGSNTPSLTTLESQLGWNSTSGTSFGSNWPSTLNADQTYWEYYTVSSPTVPTVYDDTVYDVGSTVPNIFDIYGDLPGYPSKDWPVYHYVTGYGYSGYGTNTASEEYVTWYDESDLNQNGHNITYSVSQLESYASGSGTNTLNWLGIVY
jgi:hypothetical protein